MTSQDCHSAELQFRRLLKSKYCTRMMPQDLSPTNHLFKYEYIDLEGNKYGPFEGGKMAEWDIKKLMDDDLIIFRLFASGKVESFRLKELKETSAAPFLELDYSASRTNYGKDENSSKKRKEPILTTERHCIEDFPLNEVQITNPMIVKTSRSPRHSSPPAKCLKFDDYQNADLSNDSVFCRTEQSSRMNGAIALRSNLLKDYHPDIYSSPPLMRLPDPHITIVKPEEARVKVFNLYQLIITVPEQLQHFPPYTTETVCCQLCKIDLSGPAMFAHLITIQHLSKISSCIFTESDVDFWIERVNVVIQSAPASALCLPGFDPELHLNETETVDEFINRTKGFVRKPSIQQIRKAIHVIDAVLDLPSATCYASSLVNRSKRKFTGKFLSVVVQKLSKDIHKPSFQKKYGTLLIDRETCTFCNIEFESFYELCRHVGTQIHRDKINNIHYHEGLVATWVRLLAAQKPSRIKDDSLSSEDPSTDQISLTDTVNSG